MQYHGGIAGAGSRLNINGDLLRTQAVKLLKPLLKIAQVQNASDQARHVAKTITDGPTEPFGPVPWFWSNQGELTIRMAGLSTGHDRTVVVGDPEDGAFSVLCFREGVLVGVDSVEHGGAHMAARKLLGGGDPVTYQEAAVPGFDLTARSKARVGAAPA